MPLSAASIHRASYHVLLLVAAAAAAAVFTTGGNGNTVPGNATAAAAVFTTGGNGNTVPGNAAAAAAAVFTTGGNGNTVPGNATVTAKTSGDDTEMYICYLCTGRNPMLIRRCPIYWDYCHLNCFEDAPSTAADVAAVPVVSPAAPARKVGGVPRETLEDEECYVMKLYENGSYVIVTMLGCSQTASCLLSCGGGDLATADGEEALAVHPGAVGVSPPVRATAPHGMSPPRLADFQRCGSQVMTATPAPRAITRVGV